MIVGKFLGEGFVAAVGLSTFSPTENGAALRQDEHAQNRRG